MRRLRLAVGVSLAVAVLAAIGGAPAPASAAGYHHCGGSFGPRGEPGQGFFHRIRAKRVGCRTARKVIKRYLRRGAGRTRVVRGYRCRLRVVTSPRDPDGTGHLRCTRHRGRRVIRSLGHP